MEGRGADLDRCGQHLPQANESSLMTSRNRIALIVAIALTGLVSLIVGILFLSRLIVEMQLKGTN